MALTNRGAKNIFDIVFRGASAPANFYAALVKTTPTVDTNTLSELTEVAAGNGYTAGGIQLNRNTTDFPSLVENDTDNRAELLIRDLVWTASGGTLPSDGAGATYLVLTDANATLGSREVWGFWSLTSARVVSDGQTLTINDPGINGTTV